MKAPESGPGPPGRVWKPPVGCSLKGGGAGAAGGCTGAPPSSGGRGGGIGGVWDEGWGGVWALRGAVAGAARTGCARAAQPQASARHTLAPTPSQRILARKLGAWSVARRAGTVASSITRSGLAGVRLCVDSWNEPSRSTLTSLQPLCPSARTCNAPKPGEISASRQSPWRCLCPLASDSRECSPPAPCRGQAPSWRPRRESSSSVRTCRPGRGFREWW